MTSSLRRLRLSRVTIVTGSLSGERSIYRLVRPCGLASDRAFGVWQMLKALKHKHGPDPAIEFGLIAVMIVVAVAIAVATITGYVR